MRTFTGYLFHKYNSNKLQSEHFLWPIGFAVFAAAITASATALTEAVEGIKGRFAEAIAKIDPAIISKLADMDIDQLKNTMMQIWGDEFRELHSYYLICHTAVPLLLIEASSAVMLLSFYGGYLSSRGEARRSYGGDMIAYANDPKNKGKLVDEPPLACGPAIGFVGSILLCGGSIMAAIIAEMISDTEYSIAMMKLAMLTDFELVSDVIYPAIAWGLIAAAVIPTVIGLIVDIANAKAYGELVKEDFKGAAPELLEL